MNTSYYGIAEVYFWILAWSIYLYLGIVNAYKKLFIAVSNLYKYDKEYNL